MEQMHPRVSVVVPTHHGAHRLPPLLRALAAQDFTEPWELVVVVDGTDSAVDHVLDQWAGLLPIHVVHLETSAGVAAALNAGVSLARGDIVIRCDDDLTPAADMIRRHAEHHGSGDRVGVIGPTRDVLSDSPYARAYGREATRRSVADVMSRPADETWRHWAAHNSVRRSELEAVGGFDESFSYREDSDLGLRLARAGVRILVDPGLAIEHRGAAQDTRTRAARAWVSGASEVLFERRHPGVNARPPGGPLTPRARAWGFATAGTAACLRSRAAADRAGALVDLVLPALPRRPSGLLVALVVESAARAGRTHGTGDHTGYRQQKAEELAREIGPQR
jgi:GT2 family glycosyltransferase